MTIRRDQGAETDEQARVAQIAVPNGTPTVFVRAVLGFGVGVVVALAPFLGKAKVPGFTALLTLFPPAMQSWLIPLSGMLMGIVCVIVTFYVNASPSKKRIELTFFRSIVVTTASFLILLGLYTSFVVAVRLLPENTTVAVVVGPSKCEPCRAFSDVECIKQLSLDEAAIDACYDCPSRRGIIFGLSCSYLTLLASFGALVGLLIMQQSMPKDKRPK
jgi:hypothetical protein